MNLLDYGQILVRRGWIMVLLALVTGVSAFLFSQTMQPVYRSTQNILIVPSRSDFGLTQAALQLLNSRVAYLQSESVAAQVIDALNLDMEPAFLRSRTTVTANRDNLSIQIDVDLEANSDEEAARFVNPITAEWGNALVRYQEELNQEARREDRIRAQKQDTPKVSLLRPNVRVNALIGAIAGFFVGAVVVFVLEFLESAVVRSRADIERVPLAVLAVVPD